MPDKNEIRLFEDRKVRSVWDEDAEKWWFSVVDVVSVLTDSDYQTARKYWKVLKGRLVKEGNELVTNCYQLKLMSADGKSYLTDVADVEQLLRIIQSIPSKKAEPFKQWLARVGRERIDEAIDPELAVNRMVRNYRRLGYGEAWINQRIKSIDVRKALTDEWDNSGVQGKEYAMLTDLMARTWSGMDTREYKHFKGLKKENLRDHMTNTELILNMLAESAATDISKVRKPRGLSESAKVAKKGANAAKAARESIEKDTGRPIVSPLNARDFNRVTDVGGDVIRPRKKIRKDS